MESHRLRGEYRAESCQHELLLPSTGVKFNFFCTVPSSYTVYPEVMSLLSEQRGDGVSSSDSSGLQVAKTDRYGFLLENGDTHSNSDDLCPRVVRHREMKWISLIKHWDQVLERKTSKIKGQCQKGIPASLRAKCWPLLCGATHRKELNSDLYEALASAPGQQSWIDVIKRDTDRQFPFHEMFQSKDSHGQQGLLRVLKAYTEFQPEEGYCQAQGPVAAVLLMNMPLEEAFWCLVQISELYLPGYYSPLLEGVLFDAALLSGVFKKTCPAAYKHMESQGVEPLMFATDWLMCLYSRHLPFNTLLRVWDLFFCYGVRVLFQVAVVLVRRCLGEARQRKECEGQMETLEQLRAVRSRVQHDHADAFIQEVCSVPLSLEDLQRLTDKQFEKWKKDRPDSTFDPRCRCHGYHMVWEKGRESDKAHNKKEKRSGNLSIPLARSHSSLSPAALRKKWRKRGSKVETEDCGGRRFSHSIKEESDEGERRRRSVCGTTEELRVGSAKKPQGLGGQFQKDCEAVGRVRVAATELRPSLELSNHSTPVFEEKLNNIGASAVPQDATHTDYGREVEKRRPSGQTGKCQQQKTKETVTGQSEDGMMTHQDEEEKAMHTETNDQGSSTPVLVPVQQANETQPLEEPQDERTNETQPLEEPQDERGNETQPLEEPQEERTNETQPLEEPQDERANETQPLEEPQEERANETQPLEVPQEERGNETQPLEEPQEERGNETQPLEVPQEERGNETQPLEEPQEERVNETQPLEEPQEERVNETQPLEVPQEERGNETQPLEEPQDERGNETQPLEVPQDERGNETQPLEEPQEERGNETQPLEEPQDERGNETQPLEEPQDERGNETQPLEEPQDERGNETQPLEEPQDERVNETQPLEEPQEERGNETQPLEEPQDERANETQPLEEPQDARANETQTLEEPQVQTSHVEDKQSKSSKAQEEKYVKSSIDEMDIQNNTKEEEMLIKRSEQGNETDRSKQEEEMYNTRSKHEDEIKHNTSESGGVELQIRSAEQAAGIDILEEVTPASICKQEEEEEVNSNEQKEEIQMDISKQDQEIKKSNNQQEEAQSDSNDEEGLQKSSSEELKQTEVNINEQGGDIQVNSSKQEEIKQAQSSDKAENILPVCLIKQQDIPEDNVQHVDTEQTDSQLDEKTHTAQQSTDEQENLCLQTPEDKEPQMQSVETEATPELQMCPSKAEQQDESESKPSEETEKEGHVAAPADESRGASGEAVMGQEHAAEERANEERHSSDFTAGDDTPQTLAMSSHACTHMQQETQIEHSGTSEPLQECSPQAQDISEGVTPETQSGVCEHDKFDKTDECRNLELQQEGEGVEPSDMPVQNTPVSVQPTNQTNLPNRPRTGSSSNPLRLRRSSSSNTYPTILSEETFRDPHQSDHRLASQQSHTQELSPDSAQQTCPPGVDTCEGSREDEACILPHPAQEDRPKRRGLFGRFKGEATSKSTVPKILIQDFSEGEEKLSAKERRRRRRDQARREKEEEKERKKREKELEKQKEKERKKTRGKSFQKLSRKGSNNDSAPGNSSSQTSGPDSTAVPHTDSYF